MAKISTRAGLAYMFGVTFCVVAGYLVMAYQSMEAFTALGTIVTALVSYYTGQSSARAVQRETVATDQNMNTEEPKEEGGN